MSQFNPSSNSPHDIQTAMFADCLANSKEIFKLIDSTFPLDSCQHYQLLPLKLEGNNLTLGMLDPSNEESLKFVNSIAKVFKYNLELKLIDAQTHQIILASYSQDGPQPGRKDLDQNKTVIDTSFNNNSIPQNDQQQSNRRRLADSAPTIIGQPDIFPAESKLTSDKSNISPNLPNLPDLPPDFDFLKDLELTPSSLNQKSTNNFDDKTTIIGGDPSQLLAQEASTNEAEIVFSEAQISDLIPETPGDLLELEQEVKIETVDFLPELMPQLSWQKLLEQAFKYKSELIALNLYSDRGSITTSINQSTQSSIDQVPLPIFCSVIDEIKRMARIPQDKIPPSKKVVLERLVKQERILLRIEFIFQDEEQKIIIQILRGQALKTYEQKQLDKMSDQALQLAKQLEKTLRKIQACFGSVELTNLRELQTVQSRINHQLRLLDK